MKKFRPVTAGQRFKVLPDYEGLSGSGPEKKLLEPLKKSGGRNSEGRISVRRRGGGHKRFYRVVDFKRDKTGMKARVMGIEYDPARSARLALVQYEDGQKRYIIAPGGLNKGDTVESGPQAEIRPGNALPLGKLPEGTYLHNLELYPGKGAQLARGAGASVQLMAKEGKFAHVKLPSGEIRLVSLSCMASVGQVGNVEHKNVSSGKAGRRRWLGRRPEVRGVAMNPVDHPLGGGEGKAAGGRPPVTPWGKPTRGFKTRKKKNVSDRFIIRRRK